MSDITVQGNSVFSELGSSSTIYRGNSAKSKIRRFTSIKSYGIVYYVPTVMPSDCTIGNIQSQSGTVIIQVTELGHNLSFSDGIRHLRGRVLFGYPKAPIIRQVYEMSNNRSLVIPNIPEDPCYAVFLTTTDFNLTDEELKRGTIDLSFTFDHDIRDIEKISVWLRTPNGNISLDKMKIFDYPGGIQEPHILLEPFKNTPSYRVPIHCISKKENEFFIVIEYKNPEINEIRRRSRTMLEKENYVIPFQAHFDNRLPYLNIADHVMLVGSKGSPNALIHLESDVIKKSFYFSPNDVKENVSQDASKNASFSYLYEEITRIFLTLDDLINCSLGGGNHNTYFVYQYDDLTPIQIGG